MASVFIRQFSLLIGGDKTEIVEFKFKNKANADKAYDMDAQGFFTITDDYGASVRFKASMIYRDSIIDFDERKKADEEIQISSMLADKRLAERVAGFQALAATLKN